MIKLAALLFFLLITPLQAEYYVYDFSATWCKPCQQVKQVLETPEVKEKLKNFHGEKVWEFDWDTETDRKYFDYYNVISVPTLIIVDEKGSLIKRHSGLITKENLLKFLEIP